MAPSFVSAMGKAVKGGFRYTMVVIQCTVMGMNVTQIVSWMELLNSGFDEIAVKID